jgi:EAL domain-containing protein (putative c-di-GMP-specific phosphodiesterase class I)
MLKEVPVNRIKLDLRFLTGDGDPEKGRIIIGCMIHMARALGMDIIAEGVETVEQAEFLNALGCTEMQGYYFFKPMPANEFEES